MAKMFEGWQQVPGLNVIECKACGGRLSMAAAEILSSAGKDLELAHLCSGEPRTPVEYAAALTDEQLFEEMHRRARRRDEEPSLICSICERQPHACTHASGSRLAGLTDEQLMAEVKRRDIEFERGYREMVADQALREECASRGWKSQLTEATDEQLATEFSRRASRLPALHLADVTVVHTPGGWRWDREIKGCPRSILIEELERDGYMVSAKPESIQIADDGRLRYRSPVGLVTVEPSTDSAWACACPADLDEKLMEEVAGRKPPQQIRVLLQPDAFLKFSSCCLAGMAIGAPSSGASYSAADFSQLSRSRSAFWRSVLSVAQVTWDGRGDSRSEGGPGIGHMRSSRLKPVQVPDQASLADLLADDEKPE